MLDYLIKNFYPDIQARYGDSASALESENPKYMALFDEVV